VVAAGAAVRAASAESVENRDAKPIKIVGICCSPRKGKTTRASLAVCLEAAEQVNEREAKWLKTSSLLLYTTDPEASGRFVIKKGREQVIEATSAAERGQPREEQRREDAQ